MVNAGPAYYNENEPYAVKWLRNLIAAGHIAPGEVDDRSIEDVYPSDLVGFTQCHFFAGIGVWSHALRGAGWPDDRPVWTGSCPCQPFSAAGKGEGFDDKRHLWPVWAALIGKRRPPVLLGEQVASKDAMVWLDLVQDDLEALGYAFGAVPFPAASVGAPHIRDRLYWVADNASMRSHGRWSGQANGCSASQLEGLREAGVVAHGDGEGLEVGGLEPARCELSAPERSGAACVVGYANGKSVRRKPGTSDSAQAGAGHRQHGDDAVSAGATRGFWSPADWIDCRDGKSRPVEPGTSPLAHGAPSRMGRLRAYGNAIVAPQARAFIETVMQCRP